MDNSKDWFHGLFSGLVIGFIMFAPTSCNLGTRLTHDEAIENNAAEWRCDPKTGDKEFVWLTTKPEAAKEANSAQENH